MKGMLAYKPAFVKVNIYMVNSSYICENWAQLCFLAKTVKKKKRKKEKIPYRHIWLAKLI